MANEKNPEYLVDGVYIADPELRKKMRKKSEPKEKKRGLLERQMHKNKKFRTLMDALEGDGGGY